jgi:hypothetical protein
MINCEECRLGRCSLTQAPYLQQLGDYIMVIPRAAALVCDVCGRLEYDPELLGKLQYLIEQSNRASGQPADSQRQWLQSNGRIGQRQRVRRSI